MLDFFDSLKPAPVQTEAGFAFYRFIICRMFSAQAASQRSPVAVSSNRLVMLRRLMPSVDKLCSMAD